LRFFGALQALALAAVACGHWGIAEGFVADLIKIGKKIDESKVEYGAAMNKLVDGKGNLIVSVEKLKKMGAKAKKALPENVLKRAENDTNNLIN
jgi:DNA recombination protein RmuC